MKVRFRDAFLEKIEFDPKTRTPWDEAVVKAFRKRMNFIRQAHSELDLYAWKSLRIEKLHGDRQHQLSMRLNDQWRLIFEIETAGPDRFIAIVTIEDYH